MPTEIRHIIFTHEELFGAYRSYRERRRQPLPDRDLAELSVSSDPDIRVAISFQGDGDDNPVVNAGVDELATALIMYCIDNRIPMPVQSTKYLQLFGSSIGLVITKDTALGTFEAV